MLDKLIKKNVFYSTEIVYPQKIIKEQQIKMNMKCSTFSFTLNYSLC